MCLILTTLAAIITTIIWKIKFPKHKNKIDILAFIYWGAAIMWSVDSIFNAAQGESFFDISLSDALLGITVISVGIIAWLIVYLIDKIRTKV